MKNAFLIFILLIAQAAHSSISNCTHEIRHSELIQLAIFKSCGSMQELTQLHAESIPVKFDNGVTDIIFLTTLKGIKKVDQQFFDPYLIKIHSSYSDLFDHSSGHWGVFSIQNVTCDQI